MPLPITPENLAAVLIAAGTAASAVLTAIGGMALWRKRKEPPPPGSADALTINLAENTKALTAMGGQFGDNLRMFSSILDLVREMHGHLKTMAHESEEQTRLARDMKDHMQAIRDTLNRSGK
jgi:hypothetical protein